MGHELPRRGQNAASALPPEAAATVAERCVRFGPILLQKSGLKVVRGVLGFLGRAGTMVLHQAAAELQD
jgi:hypothetical protein